MKAAGIPSRRDGEGAVPINKKWFVDRMADRQISQNQLAKFLNLHGAALSRTFSGDRRMQTQEAIAIANLLGVTLDEVLTHAGVRTELPGGTKAQVRGSVKNGVVHPSRSARPVKAPEPGFEALTVPETRWTLFYKPASAISPDAIGRLAVVELLDQTYKGSSKVVVGTVHATDRSGRYDVELFQSGELLTSERIASASPVFWIGT